MSISAGGEQANADSLDVSISADGRCVAFASDADNLVAGDTNGVREVYLYDRGTGMIERIAVDADGNGGNEHSYFPSVSSDGCYVAFYSEASNLLSGDVNARGDVFVRDRQAGTIELISVDSSGNQANDTSSLPAISADAHYVFFQSRASNLVGGDSNAARDIFVRDRHAGTTERVSVGSGGSETNSDSWYFSITPDGRCVAFASDADNLVAGDTNGVQDTFVRDLQAGTTERVSVDSSGDEADDASYGVCGISADGRYVAFCSAATNLVDDDTNGQMDVFVHDRQTGVTERVSVSSAGEQSTPWHSSGPSISADGRYVAFHSNCTNLVSGDTNMADDVFVHDRQTGTTSRVSVDASGIETNQFGNSGSARLSSDGRYAAFSSNANNLVGGDTNGVRDVFVAPVP
ncbi:MAG: PD40 domain-containing protein [Spirochaetales bacterium]|nr:PD40 domain-containing protein [Spirochaetales bacterium]